MVEILTNSYSFLVGLIALLPPPIYYFIQFFFGSVLLSAFMYIFNKFTSGGD